MNKYQTILILVILSLQLSSVFSIPRPRRYARLPRCGTEECPEGQVWDRNLCDCVCHTRICPIGRQVFDTESCKCVDDVCQERQCESYQKFNPQSCNCECKFVGRCLRRQVWDPEFCTCVFQRSFLNHLDEEN